MAPVIQLPSRLVAVVIDHAPAWIWKAGNIRWVGPKIVHFCYDGDGHRTVEWDTREVARGVREWPPPGDIDER